MPTPIEELETMLPVILEKEKQGLILPSYQKAESLVQLVKRGRPLTDKQQLLVGRLLVRAKRKHKNGSKIQIVNNTTVDVAAVAAQVKQMLATDAIDTNAVIDAVMKRMDERKPRQVEISVRVGEEKPRKIRGSTHRMFEHLLRAGSVVRGKNTGIFLQGEASSGKTTGCRQAAEALGLKWHFNGAISFPHEMLGFIDGAGKYHRTPFREAYENGGWYTFDEVDRSDPVALLAVNPHLAGDVATFPDKQVKRHKDCIISATANTWGLGADANYSGATKLDAAFLSRFPIRINWDIDPVLEEAIVGNDEWLKRVRHARERARAVGLKVMIDTRVAKAGADLIAIGYNMDTAAAMTYMANLKPEQRMQLA